MDVLDALMTRCSIRRFRRERVPREVVNKFLQVLFRSPSAADARPWQFVVIDRPDVLDALGRAMPHCDMLLSAPLGILICADPAREKIPGFWPQDCAAAAENLLLAAHGVGLGAVWIGLHPVPDRERTVRELLKVPESLIPFALIAIGPPAERPTWEDRYDPSRIHWNAWGVHESDARTC